MTTFAFIKQSFGQPVFLKVQPISFSATNIPPSTFRLTDLITHIPSCLKTPESHSSSPETSNTSPTPSTQLQANILNLKLQGIRQKLHTRRDHKRDHTQRRTLHHHQYFPLPSHAPITQQSTNHQRPHPSLLYQRPRPPPEILRPERWRYVIHTSHHSFPAPSHNENVIVFVAVVDTNNHPLHQKQ